MPKKTYVDQVEDVGAVTYTRLEPTFRGVYMTSQAHAQLYVAYYRVSTERQGRSGLGLEAQRRIVEEYVAGVGGEIISPPFIEVETGRKSDRPEMRKAIALARQSKAKLVIAKLDRLARNVAFVSTIMESGVDFVAADMPSANKFMLHVLAAVAEYEAKLISARTKEGLASRRARGLPMGNPANLKRGSQTAARLSSARARHHAERLRPVVDHLRAQGAATIRQLALALNERGYQAPNGGRWHLQTVQRLIRRLDPPTLNR